MTKLTSDSTKVHNSWNKYWQGTGNIGAFTSGGASHPAISTHWEIFFNNIKRDFENPAIIDIASGNGAVIEYALNVFGTENNDITSQDVSIAAIENIYNRFPSAKGIVSDARSIPRDTASFDIVTSQFGVEYAGQDAIYESARLVTEGGILGLVLHSESGSIHQECIESLDAVKRMQASGFIPFAIEMFDAGFKAVQGSDRSEYDIAAKKLAPAIIELEEIMKQYGQDVAGNTIVRLYNDVAQIHEKIQNYEADEILDWLRKMDEELKAYVGRMSSMSKSAIDKSDFNNIKSNLKIRGFSIETADKLFIPEQERPMAWILIAKKINSDYYKKNNCMDEKQNTGNSESSELDDWIKEKQNSAIQKFIKKYKVNSPVIEAKPSWMLPFDVLIGKIRVKEMYDDFKWFICGDIPTDYLESSVAKTPKEAARHFCMKWQLTASNYEGKNTNQSSSQINQDDIVKNLIHQSQRLYTLVEDERLWRERKSS